MASVAACSLPYKLLRHPFSRLAARPELLGMDVATMRGKQWARATEQTAVPHLGFNRRKATRGTTGRSQDKLHRTNGLFGLSYKMFPRPVT